MFKPSQPPVLNFGGGDLETLELEQIDHRLAPDGPGCIMTDSELRDQVMAATAKANREPWRSRRERTAPAKLRQTIAASIFNHLQEPMLKDVFEELAPGNYLEMAAAALVTNHNNTDKEAEWQKLIAATPLDRPIKITSKNIYEIEVPRNVSEVIKSPERVEWSSSMFEELKSFSDKEVFSEERFFDEELPSDAVKINFMWVFAAKISKSGYIDRLKAHLCIRGDQIKPFSDECSYAPCPSASTMRFMASIAANNPEWVYGNWDIKTAYLNAKNTRPFYAKPPVLPGEEPSTKWARVLRSVYGDREAMFTWFKTLSGFFIDNDFIQLQSDGAVFLRTAAQGDYGFMLVSVHSDDGVVNAEHESEFKKLCIDLDDKFGLKSVDLKLTRVTGINVSRGENGEVFFNQAPFIQSMLNEYGMIDAKPIKAVPGVDDLTGEMEPKLKDAPFGEPGVSDFLRLIGQFQWLAQRTVPQLLYFTQRIGRYSANPALQHFMRLRSGIRYLKFVCHLPLVFSAGNSKLLTVDAVCDASFAPDVETQRRSTCGGIVRVNGNYIDGFATLAKAVHCSTTDSETTTASYAGQRVVQARMFAAEIGMLDLEPSKLWGDNKGALQRIKRPADSTARSKHVDTRFWYVRHLERIGLIRVCWVASEENCADILTKSIPAKHFERHATTIREGVTLTTETESNVAVPGAPD